MKNSIIKKLDYLFLHLFFGFFTGLDISWFLMKITYLDMRINTTIFLPIGIITSFLFFIIQSFRHHQKLFPNSISSFFKLSFWALTILTAGSLFSNLDGPFVVLPILVRDGLKLPKINLPIISWSILIFFTLGILRLVFCFLNSFSSKELKSDFDYRSRS